MTILALLVWILVLTVIFGVVVLLVVMLLLLLDAFGVLDTGAGFLSHPVRHP